MAALPNAAKTINAPKCQSIYMNLLSLREQDKQLQAFHWLREFEQTKRCDGETDFSRERQEYREHIGEEPVKRALSYALPEQGDQERVEQAVIHYFDWHQKRLVSALNWTNYFKYQIFYKHERLLTWFGIAGSLTGGWLFVRNRLKKTAQEAVDRAKALNEASKVKAGTPPS